VISEIDYTIDCLVFSLIFTDKATFTFADVALVGGGAYPQPGEISLSHNGLLFLDDLPEIKRGVLDVLGQSLEDHEVTKLNSH